MDLVGQVATGTPVVTPHDVPVNPGLWLPKFGGTAQFFFHSVGESSTCSCVRCFETKTSLILPVWL
jgi:hypothetical protein